MRRTKTALILLGFAGGVVSVSPASPYAVEVISAQEPFGNAPYHDTNAVLGMPATRFYNPFGGWSGGVTNPRVKLVEAAYNVAPSTNGLITTNLLLTLNEGSHIIARFAQPVTNHPANPYGIDFLVFGNAFYSADVFINESTDLNAAILTGGPFGEPMKISVSPGYTGQPGESATDPNTWPWYRYESGPFGDGPFPTHAYRWDRQTTNWTEQLMDFTKPVNPVLDEVLSAGGMFVADAIELYAGSGGGTGFDLEPSGFSWIQYVKVEGLGPDFSGGEIDAFSIVRRLQLGDEISVAPANLTNNTAQFVFYHSHDENRTSATVQFTQLDALAKVNTALLPNPADRAPIAGIPENAVEFQVTPLLSVSPVTFQANLILAADESYAGSGADLDVVQWTGTDWQRLPFDFDAAAKTASIIGLTNLTAFVLFKISPPILFLSQENATTTVHFSPVPGWQHTLERSVDLAQWSAVTNVTPLTSDSVGLLDPSPPATRAYYRLRLERR